MSDSQPPDVRTVAEKKADDQPQEEDASEDEEGKVLDDQVNPAVSQEATPTFSSSVDSSAAGFLSKSPEAKQPTETDLKESQLVRAQPAPFRQVMPESYQLQALTSFNATELLIQ